MQIGYKEYYNSAASTKVLEVSLLKVFYVYPEFLEPKYPEPPLRIDALGYNGEINYHSDFLYADYEYTEEYADLISEEMKKTVVNAEGILQQTVWKVTIIDCNFDSGTSAEELASSVPWTLDTYYSFFGEELLTKVLTAKFSTSFFTKCAILSEIWTNHSKDANLAEFIDYNDDENQLDDDDRGNYEYVEETWVQLCETLGVDQDGDYNTYKDMIANK
jgi:hypothetical protein